MSVSSLLLYAVEESAVGSKRTWTLCAIQLPGPPVSAGTRQLLEALKQTEAVPMETTVMSPGCSQKH